LEARRTSPDSMYAIFEQVREKWHPLAVGNIFHLAQQAM
jgi:hypothetical protein